MKKLLCSALLLAMTLAAQAEVKLPKIFGDNMVLQQIATADGMQPLGYC